MKKVRPQIRTNLNIRGTTLVLSFLSTLPFNAGVRAGLVPLIDPFVLVIIFGLHYPKLTVIILRILLFLFFVLMVISYNSYSFNATSNSSRSMFNLFTTAINGSFVVKSTPAFLTWLTG